MDDVRGLPTLHFFEGLAVIIKPSLIGEFEFTGWTHRSHEAWNAGNRQAKTLFARAQGVLGSLPVFNLSGNTIPANHATTVIAQGLSIGTKPAIDVIEPAHTLVYFARLTGFHGVQPCLFR